jgi:hypothetical protein
MNMIDQTKANLPDDQEMFPILTFSQKCLISHFPFASLTGAMHRRPDRRRLLYRVIATWMLLG